MNVLSDIESLQPDSLPAPTTNGNVQRKRKAIVVGSPADAAPKHWRDVLGPAPSHGESADELKTWLAFHRQKWSWLRKNKQQRKKSRTDNYDSGIRVSGTGIRAFVKQAKKEIVEELWQVIQVRKTYWKNQTMLKIIIVI